MTPRAEKPKQSTVARNVTEKKIAGKPVVRHEAVTETDTKVVSTGTGKP